jgi:hypothetical protein
MNSVHGPGFPNYPPVHRGMEHCTLPPKYAQLDYDGLRAPPIGGTCPVLIGHSLGGTFAAILPAREPDPVRSCSSSRHRCPWGRGRDALRGLSSRRLQNRCYRPYPDCIGVPNIEVLLGSGPTGIPAGGACGRCRGPPRWLMQVRSGARCLCSMAERLPDATHDTRKGLAQHRDDTHKH